MEVRYSPFWLPSWTLQRTTDGLEYQSEVGSDLKGCKSLETSYADTAESLQPRNIVGEQDLHKAALIDAVELIHQAWDEARKIWDEEELEEDDVVEESFEL